MKLFKLIKSIDYVTYPSYRELVKIRNAVSNSLASFRNILISSMIGVLFEVAPISDYIVTKFMNNHPVGCCKARSDYENTSLLISIVVALIAYLIISLVRSVCIRFRSNKDTKSKRDTLVYEFYKIAIPQLIEVKSILEQMDEKPSRYERKKKLLLLQAKHEICDLYRLVSEMRVIERKKMGLLTQESKVLHDRIGKSTYSIFLEEMLETMYDIYSKLSGYNVSKIQDEIEEIKANINEMGIFNEIDDNNERLREIRKNINKN